MHVGLGRMGLMSTGGADSHARVLYMGGYYAWVWMPMGDDTQCGLLMRMGYGAHGRVVHLHWPDLWHF